MTLGSSEPSYSRTAESVRDAIPVGHQGGQIDGASPDFRSGTGRPVDIGGSQTQPAVATATKCPSWGQDIHPARQAEDDDGHLGVDRHFPAGGPKHVVAVDDHLRQCNP
jgi:hypothetical protein